MITTKKRSEILEALLLALYEGKSVTVCTDEPGFGIRHIDDCDPIHEVASSPKDSNSRRKMSPCHIGVISSPQAQRCTACYAMEMMAKSTCIR